MKIVAFSLSQCFDAAKTAKKVFTQADRALGIQTVLQTWSPQLKSMLSKVKI